MDVTLTVNGTPHVLDLEDPRVSLLDALRQRLDLTGPRLEPMLRSFMRDRRRSTESLDLPLYALRSFMADRRAGYDRAAQALIGRHDFTTFRSAMCQSPSPVKTLDRIEIVDLRHQDQRAGIVVDAIAVAAIRHRVDRMLEHAGGVAHPPGSGG